jgi:hypothetical protein
VSLPSHPTDEEILGVVESWLDDLASDDYETAFSRTGHDPYYNWTPELMRAVVSGYGLPEPHHSGVVFAVTNRASARGKPFHREVQREDLRPATIAEVIYDIPLNGEWSDLTATFRVETHADGSALILQEIHVF